jgi:hypothetical protein
MTTAEATLVPMVFADGHWEPLRRRLSHLLRYERALRHIVAHIGEEAPPVKLSFGDFDLLLLGMHALGAFRPPYRKTPPNGLYKLSRPGNAPVPAFRGKDGQLMAYNIERMRSPDAFVPVEVDEHRGPVLH